MGARANSPLFPEFSHQIRELMSLKTASEWIEASLAGAEEHRRKTGLPLVTLSYAQSLDGSLTLRRGKPFALSGPQSLELTHRLRAAHDGILVGIGTVLADNPRLNVRLAKGPSPQPVVLDSQLRIPPDARLLTGEGLRPWIAATTGFERALILERAGAKILSFSPDEQGKIPLHDMLRCLADLGMNSLMVEGGARVITAFLSQRLADLAVITVAPLWLGGLRALEVPIGEQGLVLEDPGYEQLGRDMVVWGRISRSPAPDEGS